MFQHGNNDYKSNCDLLVSSFSALADDLSEVKSCLASACKGGHKDLIQFWLIHLDKIYGQRPSIIDFNEDAEENIPVIAACRGKYCIYLNQVWKVFSNDAL